MTRSAHRVVTRLSRTACVAATLSLALTATLTSMPHASAQVSFVPTEPIRVAAWTGEDSVKVSWNAPGDSGGHMVTSYTASVWSSPPPTGGMNLVRVCTTVDLGCEMTGLLPGHTYYVDVFATNSDGDGGVSTYVTIHPGNAPTRVRDVSVRAAVGKVIVTWQKPLDFGPGRFTWYRAAAFAPGGIGAGTSTDTCVSERRRELTCTIYGLTNGATYDIAAWAKTSLGSGPQSTRIPVLVGKVPGRPLNVRARGLDRAGTVRWEAPTSNGGLKITSYTVRIFKLGRDRVVTSCVTGGGARTCTVNGLTNGVRYEASVTARNAVGVGRPSERDPFRPHT